MTGVQTCALPISFYFSILCLEDNDKNEVERIVKLKLQKFTSFIRMTYFIILNDKKAWLADCQTVDGMPGPAISPVPTKLAFL